MHLDVGVTEGDQKEEVEDQKEEVEDLRGEVIDLRKS